LSENVALTEGVYYVLLSLYTPLHGYGIMQNAEKMSNGRVKLAAGTLYGILDSLVKKKWIEALPVESGSRQKKYIITEQGKENLFTEMSRLRELLENGKAVTGGYYENNS
jgi:DNA-binding PadR family transcriptional regulator